MSKIARAERESEKSTRGGLCSYRAGELWCPLPGVHCDTPKGEAWYCWLHASNRPKPDTLAEQDLRDIIARQDELRRERRHDPIQVEITRRMDEHPEWRKRPDESSEVYARRMLVTLRFMGGVARGLPYDKGTSVSGDDYARAEREAIQALD